MGIKGFSKVFKSTRIVKLKDLKGQTIAIDAMTEIYRSALGAKSVVTLTDRNGNPTLHINVIFANIIEMQKQGIDQLWIFDHDQSPDKNKEFHNPAKIEELLKRQKRKDDAKSKLAELTAVKEKVLFSDDEGEGDEQEQPDEQEADTKPKTKTTQEKKDSLEKQLFSASKAMINDVKLIFNCLNIRYIESPAGFEGEQIAAYLSATDQCSAVYSGDTDPIPFGAKVLLRKNPRDKKIYEYTQEDIIKQIQEQYMGDNANYTADLNELRKACVAMGSDFAPKTPRLGDKTILKKLHTVKLTTKQKEAIKQFEKEPDDDIVVENLDSEPFDQSTCRVDLLMDWLVNEKSFSKTKVYNWLSKVMDLPKLDAQVKTKDIDTDE